MDLSLAHINSLGGLAPPPNEDFFAFVSNVELPGLGADSTTGWYAIRWWDNSVEIRAGNYGGWGNGGQPDDPTPPFPKLIQLYSCAGQFDATPTGTLTYVNIQANDCDNFNLQGGTTLVELNLSYNSIIDFGIVGAPYNNLKYLDLSFNSSLTTLVVSGPKLEYLNCTGCNISNLNIVDCNPKGSYSSSYPSYTIWGVNFANNNLSAQALNAFYAGLETPALSNIGVLAFDEDMQDRTLALVSGSEVYTLQNFSASLRSVRIPITRSASMSVRALDLDPVVDYPVTIPPEMLNPLLVVVPYGGHPSGLRVFVIDDVPASFPWGCYRFYNTTDTDYTINIDSVATTALASWPWRPATIQLGGSERGVVVEVPNPYEDPEDENDDLLYSAVWDFDPLERYLIFIKHLDGAPVTLYGWDFEGEDYEDPVESNEGVGPAVLTAQLVGDAAVQQGVADEENYISEHLQISEPVGSTITFQMPTVDFWKIELSYQTWRTSDGPEEQTLSYTVDGENWIDLQTYSVDEAPPQTKTFNFHAIPAVNNNPDFAVRISFAEGAGGTTGSNMFDDLILTGQLIEPPPPDPENPPPTPQLVLHMVTQDQIAYAVQQPEPPAVRGYINVEGNPGIDDDDPTIATAKGYIVYGSVSPP